MKHVTRTAGLATAVSGLFGAGISGMVLGGTLSAGLAAAAPLLAVGAAGYVVYQYGPESIDYLHKGSQATGVALREGWTLTKEYASAAHDASIAAYNRATVGATEAWIGAKEKSAAMLDSASSALIRAEESLEDAWNSAATKVKSWF
jgi:hypothetical protein